MSVKLPKNGITIVEILIAAVIIAVTFLAILSVIQYGSKSTVKINNYSKAFRLAQEFIEEFKHVPIGKFLEDPNITQANDWFPANPAYCPKTSKSVEEFKGELKSLNFDPQVKVVPDDSGAIKLILIRVQVDWHEGDGTTNVSPRRIRLANAIYNSTVVRD